MWSGTAGGGVMPDPAFPALQMAQGRQKAEATAHSSSVTKPMAVQVTAALLQCHKPPHGWRRATDKRWHHCLAFVFIATLLGSATVLAAQFQRVTVARVIDGDSLVAVNAQNERLNIRLAGIDAPEMQQPYGPQSRENLARLLAGGEASLDCPKQDRFRRHVCEVRVGEDDVGLEQVRAGMAWWYRQYQQEQTPAARAHYAQAEAEARAARRGLWSAPAIEPAQWRRLQREASAAKTEGQSPAIPSVQ